MASNYSAYNSQHNNAPQYVYYASALARPPHPSSYYYAPAVPVPALPPGQLHPRSRSFNDLYAGYYPHQSMGPAPMASPNLSLSSAPAAIPPIAPSSSVDQHLNHHARSESQVTALAANAAAQSAVTTQPAGSGSKPLRYRGRVARSKSHSSLLTPHGPVNPSTQPSDVAANVPALTTTPPLSGPHGRRMSSTSSLHRHKHYSASMSSNEGGSTPSIMSVADTDSLTTQTSVSSVSSLDEDTKSLKLNQGRRRSMANTLVENTDVPIENADEFEGDPKMPHIELQEATSVAAQPGINKHDTEENGGPEAPRPAGMDSSRGVQMKQPHLDADADTSLESVVTDAPNVEERTEVSSKDSCLEQGGPTEKPTVNEKSIESISAAPKPVAPRAGASALAPGPSDAPAQKGTLSRAHAKHATSQASEASQAREASIKPARSAKEALPSQEALSIDTKDVSKELDAPKDQPSTPDVAPTNRDSSALSRPKRATAATPSMLVLPSDLHPRSYYQAATASESKDTSGDARHARSASWYTGASPVTDNPGLADALRNVTPPHTATSGERLGTQSSQLETSNTNDVFLRRSYASRQRPSVQSMPPRRPESLVVNTQAAGSHHPLPRQPSLPSPQEKRHSSLPSPLEHSVGRKTSNLPSPIRPASVMSQRPSSFASAKSLVPEPPLQAQNVRHSRSFGSRLKSMFTKEKPAQSNDDNSDATSIVSTRSAKSSISVRSSSSGLSSLSSRFRRKRGSLTENIEAPAPPPAAMTRSSLRGPASTTHDASPLSRPTPKSPSGSSSSYQEAPRPPSPALSSIGRQVAPNLTAGDIYPGLLRPNEVDTIISSLERTGSFERKLSTSRRSKEEKVPDEQVIKAPEPAASPEPGHQPLRSALKSSMSARSVANRDRRISFAKNTLVYNTYSASDYNRTPEPLPYDFRDSRVVTQLYRELNDVKLSMHVHPHSRHHTAYVFNPEERFLRALKS